MEDNTAYKVVLDYDEENYSIWPADRPNRPGWKDVGFTGTKTECMVRAAELMQDMRPPSLSIKDRQ